MSLKETLTGSDLKTNDVVVSFCDPCFFPEKYSKADKMTLIKKLFTYALYADRIIVANRYFRTGGILFEVLKEIPILLNEGVIVPDIQEGYESFSDFGCWYQGAYNIDISEAMQFADENASVRFSFDGQEQGDNYKLSLSTDLNKGGFLYESLAKGNPEKQEQFAALAEYVSKIQGDTREEFVNYATQMMPDYKDDWKTLAALRYYLVPAEIQNPCVREFPQKVVNKLNDYHPFFNEAGKIELSQEASVEKLFSEVFCDIGNIESSIEIQAMAEAVLEVRSKKKDLCSLVASLTKKDYKSEICTDVSKELLNEYRKEVSRGLQNRWVDGLLTRTVVGLSAHVFSNDFLVDLLAAEGIYQIAHFYDVKHKPVILASTVLKRAYRKALKDKQQ